MNNIMLTKYSRLRYLANQAFIIVALFLSVIFLLSVDNEQPRIVKYDCSLAEISPDYPLQVKEDCRRLHYEQYKKEHKTAVQT